MAGFKIPDSGGIEPIALHIEWWDWVMRDGPKPEFLKDNFIYYVLGEELREWRYAPSLSAVEAETETFWLTTTGEDATSIERAGALTQTQPTDGVASYTFDPTDLSKAIKASWISGNYIFHDEDIKAIDGEATIFETAPFETEMELIGRPRFYAKLGVDTPDTDFQIRLL